MYVPCLEYKCLLVRSNPLSRSAQDTHTKPASRNIKEPATSSPPLPKVSPTHTLSQQQCIPGRVYGMLLTVLLYIGLLPGLDEAVSIHAWIKGIPSAVNVVLPGSVAEWPLSACSPVWIRCAQPVECNTDILKPGWSESNLQRSRLRELLGSVRNTLLVSPTYEVMCTGKLGQQQTNLHVGVAHMEGQGGVAHALCMSELIGQLIIICPHAQCMHYHHPLSITSSNRKPL